MMDFAAIWEPHRFWPAVRDITVKCMEVEKKPYCKKILCACRPLENTKKMTDKFFQRTTKIVENKVNDQPIPATILAYFILNPFERGQNTISSYIVSDRTGICNHDSADKPNPALGVTLHRWMNLVRWRHWKPGHTDHRYVTYIRIYKIFHRYCASVIEESIQTGQQLPVGWKYSASNLVRFRNKIIAEHPNDTSLPRQVVTLREYFRDFSDDFCEGDVFGSDLIERADAARLTMEGQKAVESVISITLKDMLLPDVVVFVSWLNGPGQSMRRLTKHGITRGFMKRLSDCVCDIYSIKKNKEAREPPERPESEKEIEKMEDNTIIIHESLLKPAKQFLTWENFQEETKSRGNHQKPKAGGADDE